VLVLLKLKRAASEPQHSLIDQLLKKCWQFVLEAKDQAGDFYNFRDAEGNWLAHDRSEDMYARIMRAAAAMMREGAPAQRTEAWRIFAELLPRADRFAYVRSAAEGIIAASELPPSFQDRPHVRSAAAAQLGVLQTHWQEHAADAWPWFEEQMTYANAMLPHGLLGAERLKLSSPESAEALHAATDFLVATTIRDGQFVPVGSAGWYPKGGTPSIDNQQAIEAGTTFDFLLEYEKTHPSRVSPASTAAPYLWFFGKNTQQQIVAREKEGAALDGLFLAGPNRNRGAESMLAYLWAELRLREAPASVRNYIAAERARLAAQTTIRS
jgi:hypothetical protein